MFVITDQFVDHTSLFDVLTAEASTLGIKPWEWPDAIEYEGVEFPQPAMHFAHDELQYVDYRQGEGLILRVFND